VSPVAAIVVGCCTLRNGYSLAVLLRWPSEASAFLRRCHTSTRPFGGNLPQRISAQASEVIYECSHMNLTRATSSHKAPKDSPTNTAKANTAPRQPKIGPKNSSASFRAVAKKSAVSFVAIRENRLAPLSVIQSFAPQCSRKSMVRQFEKQMGMVGRC